MHYFASSTYTMCSRARIIRLDIPIRQRCRAKRGVHEDESGGVNIHVYIFCAGVGFGCV